MYLESLSSLRILSKLNVGIEKETQYMVNVAVLGYGTVGAGVVSEIVE